MFGFDAVSIIPFQLEKRKRIRKKLIRKGDDCLVKIVDSILWILFRPSYAYAADEILEIRAGFMKNPVKNTEVYFKNAGLL